MEVLMASASEEKMILKLHVICVEYIAELDATAYLWVRVGYSNEF